MINIRPVLFIIGVLLMIEAAAMVIPILVDLHYGNPDWKIFTASCLTVGFVGALLFITNREDNIRITTRSAFIMTTLAWVVIGLAGSIPLYYSGLDLSFTDSFFEATSGLTTTGSTILRDIEAAPPGILIWRAILQWLGGVGVLIMALSVLPFLNIGGMQLFKMEAFEDEKALPKTTKLAGNIAGLYLILTVICYFCLLMAGMHPFDAAAHAMTTLATGGYSTHNASLGHYSTMAPTWVITLFMILASLPFILYVKFVRGNGKALINDHQVRWFLAILGFCIIATTVALSTNLSENSFLKNLNLASFNVTSLMTGTGYASTDYMAWGPFFILFSFFFMVIGGCAGSTTCGIKVFRFQVLYALSVAQMKKLVFPHAVVVPRYNNMPIPPGVSGSVLAFFFLFSLSFSVVAILLSFTGMDFISAMSSAATAIANVGPALGAEVGPSGNFALLPDTAKWVMSVAMILGRLELFTVLVMLSPSFWKK